MFTCFWSHLKTKPYWQFSFSADIGFTHHATNYNCALQYLLAKKASLFKDFESFYKITHSTNPLEQLKISLRIKNYNEFTWLSHARQIAYEGNLAKFSDIRNTDALNVLLATRGTAIVEASPYDKIWGAGLNAEAVLALEKWRGRNWGGATLMQVRDKIIRERAK